MNPRVNIKSCSAGRSYLAGSSLEFSNLIIVNNILKPLHYLAHPLMCDIPSFAQQFVSILPHLPLYSGSKKATGEINYISVSA
jgi:hypothetical protein